ncbi:homeobox and C2H2 transcription factor [Hirsutella rhossiliensis]|uniref:Homeobox and C2H2 transcription factor n=1 Tax=Hirsutella rhossiliensis TaxID=111463 RepID=A0A9P8MRB8_9HYPO|nr:homeobox and C2H2 transcription factor [Hirsutella rhossiliensis]KAH0959054.1 homeobox and C2H2 transcription factor [Hirsutella rhossiliensis]
MDQNQHHQQLRQSGSLPTPHQGSSASSPSQLDLDSTPQDVLAEARKNLQVLIDSGFSRDLLHQWVDDSQSLQFPLPITAQSFASPQSQPQHSPTPQHPPPPPPPQRCAPPPSPSRTPSASERPTPVVSVSGPPPSAAPPPVPSIAIKPETLPDDVSRTWPPSTLASPNPPPERPTTGVHDADSSIFMAPPAPFSHSHRPRISISSVSSGSSGHASIWSTNSAQSSFSWHSATTGNRAMAPLPMPPPAGGMPVLNGSHVGSSATSPGRQNVYWCTSCETSFKRKYDWKRHEDEFHERWRKYPCPEPGCNRSFWGSNSFNQHHKQCHGCKTCPHAEKVVKFLRKRKYWACGFCSALHPARERHVEHVARHFESGMTKGDWMHSRVVYGLLHQPLIHEAWDALVNSKQPDYTGRRPQFSWHPSKTGRAQGFLEKESAGQLQDLLEFFSGDEGEAQWIVTSAYELADIVLTSGPLGSPQFSGPPATSMGPPQQYPSQDVHAAFPTVPSQSSHQSMMPSPNPNSHDSYTSTFRNTMFVPSQQFSTASGPSPESSSHSPLAASHSPLTASQSPLPSSHSPLETRALLSSSSSGHASADSMDFEYSPAPVAFEGWDAISGGGMHDTTPQPSDAGHQGAWGMMQYFGDPRVTS